MTCVLILQDAMRFAVELHRRRCVLTAKHDTIPTSAVLSVDMADESGKFVSDSNSLGIESMKLHKQRLSKLGKSAHKGDYKLPAPDLVTIVGGMLVSDSQQVRGSQCSPQL